MSWERAGPRTRRTNDARVSPSISLRDMEVTTNKSERKTRLYARPDSALFLFAAEDPAEHQGVGAAGDAVIRRVEVLCVQVWSEAPACAEVAESRTVRGDVVGLQQGRAKEHMARQVMLNGGVNTRETVGGRSGVRVPNTHRPARQIERQDRSIRERISEADGRAAPMSALSFVIAGRAVAQSRSEPRPGDPIIEPRCQPSAKPHPKFARMARHLALGSAKEAVAIIQPERSPGIEIACE